MSIKRILKHSFNQKISKCPNRETRIDSDMMQHSFVNICRCCCFSFVIALIEQYKRIIMIKRFTNAIKANAIDSTSYI